MFFIPVTCFKKNEKVSHTATDPGFSIGKLDDAHKYDTVAWKESQVEELEGMVRVLRSELEAYERDIHDSSEAMEGSEKRLNRA